MKISPGQATACEASGELVSPPPSMALTTSRPAGEVRPSCPATSLAQFTPRLTTEDTRWLLRALEAYGGILVREVPVTRFSPLFQGRCSSLL